MKKSKTDMLNRQYELFNMKMMNPFKTCIQGSLQSHIIPICKVLKTTQYFIFLQESWTSKVEVIEEATYILRMVTQSNTPIIFKPRIK